MQVSFAGSARVALDVSAARTAYPSIADKLAAGWVRSAARSLVSTRPCASASRTFGSAGNGVRGPALVAGLCAAATTFFAVKFLLKFFETNRLTPFGVYCVGLGLTCTLVFALGG